VQDDGGEPDREHRCRCPGRHPVTGQPQRHEDHAIDEARPEPRPEGPVPLDCRCDHDVPSFIRPVPPRTPLDQCPLATEKDGRSSARPFLTRASTCRACAPSGSRDSGRGVKSSEETQTEVPERKGPHRMAGWPKQLGVLAAVLLAAAGLLDASRVFLLSSRSFTCTVSSRLSWCGCRVVDCSRAADFLECINSNRECEQK